MDESPLLERIRAAVGNRSNRLVAELTATGAESVRRYMDGATPSAEFLSGLCRSLGVSGEWLLTGRGPMRSADVPAQALRDAPAPDLLGALASAVEALIERVDRLEVFLSTLETRVRAGAPASGGPHELPLAADRVKFVAGAVAQRTRADARADAPPRGA